MDPQPRVQLIGHLYALSLRGVSEALALVRAPALAGAEKERLYASVETAVWALPEDVFTDSAEDGWEDRAADDARVREALERVVDELLAPRRKPA